MMNKIKHEEMEFTGEEARKYADKHKKWAGLMYGTLLRDFRMYNRKGRFLEIGAGPCLLTTLVADINPETHITTVDISADMVAVGSEYVKEKKLDERVTCVVGDVQDEEMMRGLGTFDVVYSALSLHHWADKEKSFTNIWNAVGDGGMMYIYDLRRIWAIGILPVHSGGMESVRSSLKPVESEALLQQLNIDNYKVKNKFPFLFQSIIAWK
jgi:SAM-dependent methyltransferase